MEKAEAKDDDANNAAASDDADAEGEDDDKKKAAPAKKSSDDAPADDAEGEGECAKEEGEGDDPEKLSDPDQAKVEAAVDFDIEADGVDEATGFDEILASESVDIHYACLEAVSSVIAFDQTDIACTEAYVLAGSEYEKKMVTESFKESVKKFGARFKAFIIKIKNAIVRIFNKAVNYVRILASKISAKFAKRIKLDKSKKVPEDATVRVADILLKSFQDVVTRGFFKKDANSYPISDALKAITDLINSGTAPEEVKKKLDEIKLPTKADIVHSIVDQGYHDVKLSTLQSKGEEYLKDLEKISDNVKLIKGERDRTEATIKGAERQAKHGDLDSAKLNALTACVNKAMSAFNTMVSALVSLQSAWISQRVKIIRALNKYQGAPESKANEFGEYAKYSGMHESANLFDHFLSMIN
jgi:hypothetical protein